MSGNWVRFTSSAGITSAVNLDSVVQMHEMPKGKGTRLFLRESNVIGEKVVRTSVTANEPINYFMELVGSKGDNRSPAKFG